MAEIKERLKELDQLCATSKNVAPLRNAMEPPKWDEPVDAVMLCDFWDETRSINYPKGQSVQVRKRSRLSNTEQPLDDHYWFITTENGEVKIPALYVGLKKDDPECVDRALS